ncbi:613_t:CDS:2, partial [Gigaspora margarita]
MKPQTVDKQPSTKICKKLRLYTWLRLQNFIDIYRYWNYESKKFTWSNGYIATRIDQIWISENLKDRIEKVEIEEIETITGSDHNNQACLEFEYGIKEELGGVQIKFVEAITNTSSKIPL